MRRPMQSQKLTKKSAQADRKLFEVVAGTRLYAFLFLLEKLKVYFRFQDLGV